ncbi:MAG: hypothetical protein M1572_06515 [Gammaproteobacteria bacterium]|nr:hypothetical protein [Gammaproteobacteria bacterium]MCL5796527.1 hypothetical protein [Gammaproteobacteria bacterium]
MQKNYIEGDNLTYQGRLWTVIHVTDTKVVMRREHDGALLTIAKEDI